MIELRNITKHYRGVPVLENVSTVINDGEVVAVIGPSGSGKSVLIRCINMLNPPDSGQIIIDGEDITAPGCDLAKVRQKVGMVFQHYNLFNNMTAVENVMIGQTKLLGLSRQEAYDGAMELLKTVGLASKALCYPEELSGGQQQRVAIARTLAMKPRTLLLDEPTSALDPSMVSEVLSVIQSLASMNLTMVVVTHKMQFAQMVASRVLFLSERGIYEDGTPDQIFEAPRGELTRQFIFRKKSFNYEIDSRSYDFYEMAGRMELFCSRQFASKKVTGRIRLVVEELLTNWMLPAYPSEQDPQVTLSLICDEGGKNACVSLHYEGLDADPFEELEDSEDFSAMILQNTTVRMDSRTPLTDSSFLLR